MIAWEEMGKTRSCARDGLQGSQARFRGFVPEGSGWFASLVLRTAFHRIDLIDTRLVNDVIPGGMGMKRMMTHRNDDDIKTRLVAR
jgi:hypothetical protein